MMQLPTLLNYRSRAAAGGFYSGLLILCAVLGTGCGKIENPSGPSQERSLAKIILQTEWYAEPEQGGFYHALIEGYYKEAGLDVEIRQGGPNALAPEKVATGKADFALARSDEAIVYASRKLLVLVVMATMQRDAQALLLHEENSVQSFSDLNGKTIMATPGASWIKILKNRYGIEFDTIPTDYGMGRYLTDKSFIQMCYVTNEPYYARLRGAHPKTLLLADSGYNPYRAVLTNHKFAQRASRSGARLRGGHFAWLARLPGGEPIAHQRSHRLIESANDRRIHEFHSRDNGELQTDGGPSGRKGTAGIGHRKTDAGANELAA